MATATTAHGSFRRLGRWYLSRYGHAPVIAGVGAVVWITALVAPLPDRLEETSAPLGGTGFSRVAYPGNAVGGLLPEDDSRRSGRA